MDHTEKREKKVGKLKKELKRKKEELNLFLDKFKDAFQNSFISGFWETAPEFGGTSDNH